MTTGATGQLGLALPVQGELSGTWGDTVNNGITQYTNIAIAGTLTLTGDGAVTLANTTGDASASNITSTLAGAGTVTAQFAVVRVSGTTGVKTVTGPSYSKSYIIDNASSYAVTFKASGQTGVSISPGEKVGVYYNGTDYVKIGGGGITYGAVKTTTYTAVANDGVQTNTTSGAFTVNLPASPATGTQVFVVDSFGTWGTNNLTIGRNGSTIEGSATDLVCDINGVSIQCIYNGTTWDIYAQVGANDTAVVTLTGTQTLTNKTLTSPTITSPTITGTGTIAAATVTLSSTLAVTGVATLSADAVVNGLTVGRGAGAVSTNTAVGASALTGNSTQANMVAVGYLALNGGGGTGSVAVGSNALGSQTSAGGPSTAVGQSALSLEVSGYYNSAFGTSALGNNISGNNCTGIGRAALAANTSSNNTAVGSSAMVTNTTGSNSVAVGFQAGYSQLSSTSNTYVGYQAGYSASTTNYNTFVGRLAGYAYTGSVNDQCVFIGNSAGSSQTTGGACTYVGPSAGTSMTTGAKNTIIGGYSGNQGGLDIRTASNYIVLSDGDGNPRGIFNDTGNFYVGKTTAGTTTPGFEVKRVDTTTTILSVTTAGYYNALFNRQSDNGDSIIFQRQNSSVGSISVTTTATAYNTSSDYRLKNTIAPMTGALAKVAQLKPCTYKWNADGSDGEGFIAHELSEVMPHAVTGNKDAVDEDGNPKYQGIDVSFLVATLTAAIQELKAEFDAYKASHP